MPSAEHKPEPMPVSAEFVVRLLMVLPEIDQPVAVADAEVAV